MRLSSPVLSALNIVLVLLFFLSPALGEEKGYCIKVASFKRAEVAENLLDEIDCSVDSKIRIEKIGDYYTLRVGFWNSKEEALKVLKKIKGKFKDAAIIKCFWKDGRIYKLKCEDRVLKSKELSPSPWASFEAVEDGSYLKLTLKELGYPTDMVLKGGSFSHTFYLPVLRSFKEGVFNLKMKLSPIAPLDGTITVEINGIPYRTYRVSQIGYLPTLSIPVLPDRMSSFSKITIKFNFLPKEEVCKSLSVSDFYVVFYNSSTYKVKVKKDFTPQDILSFLVDYRGELWVEGESLPSISEVAYYTAALYKGFSLYNLKFSPSAAKKIVLTGGDTVLKGSSTLFLRPEDLETLRFLWPLRTKTFTSSVYPQELLPGEFLPLKYFGFKTQTAEGVGNVVISFKVPFYTLRGKPKKVLLLLKYSAQRVDINSGDKLWLSLVVNGSLVWSRQLVGVSSLQENLIDVPGYALKFGENTFSVIFSYYPGMGTCEGSVPSLKFTLFDTSAISYFGIDREYSTVQEIAASLSGTVGLVVDDEISHQFALELFKLLGFYNHHVDEFDLTPGEGKDFYVVVKPLKKLKSEKVPIRYTGEAIRVYNPLTGKTVLEVKGEYNFILFQLGEFRGAPALFVSPSNPRAQSSISAIEWSDFDRFLGNAVFLFKDSVYPFEIGKKYRVEYSKRTAVEYYLKKYRVIFFVILFVLITAFTVYLWRRLT